MLGRQAALRFQLQFISRLLVLASCVATAVVRVTPSDDLQAVLVTSHPEGTTFQLTPGIYRNQGHGLSRNEFQAAGQELGGKLIVLPETGRFCGDVAASETTRWKSDDTSGEFTRASATAFVRGDQAAARVSEQFLSVAIDGASLVVDGGLDFTSDELRQYTAALSPAVLRVGGEDLLYFDDGTTGKTWPPSQHALNATYWDTIMNFARDVKMPVVFTLSSFLRNSDNTWDSTNFERMLAYNARHNYDRLMYGWSLGDEPGLGYDPRPGYDPITPEVHAKSFAALRQLAPEAQRILGPDWCWVGANACNETYLEQFLRAVNRNSIDTFTWHYYPIFCSNHPTTCHNQQLDVFWNTTVMYDRLGAPLADAQRLAALYLPQVPVALHETGNANDGGLPGASDTYASTFWWLNQLGTVAAAGNQLMVRQDLVGWSAIGEKSWYTLLDSRAGGEYTPNPDYYTGVAWKELMGTTVLQVGVTGAPQSLRVFAHCLRDSTNGSVSMVAVNIEPTAIRVDVAGINATGVRGDLVFSRCSPGDSLSTKSICGNGLRLRGPGRGGWTLKHSNCRGDQPSPLVLPAYSAAFSVFYAAQAPACMVPVTTLKTDDLAGLHGSHIPISVSELATAVSLLSAELGQLRSDFARRATAGTRPVTLFGAVCDGVTNDTAAFQLAVDSTSAGGMLHLPLGRCYLGAPVTIKDKAISIRGEGTGSVLVGDGDILVGVNASGSQLSDFAIELHTQPWSFDLLSDTNDFLSLFNVTKTLTRSTNGQFSYSVNFNNKVPGLDQALRTEQKEQQEGLKVGVTFSRSDHVRIRGIFGTWATITIVDGSYCTVSECDIKGGNDALGTIVFINGDNDVSYGLHNRAIHNTIRNGANSGIVLLRQKYTQLHGNTLIQVGESGEFAAHPILQLCDHTQRGAGTLVC